MFTGIVEDLGKVEALEKEGSNLHLSVSSSLCKELKIDQSVAHNGVCLTVVDIDLQKSIYKVTIIDESLKKSNLGELKLGDKINLERAAQLNSRLDGHMVQGHVDQTGTCSSITSQGGSWVFRFQFKKSDQTLIVDKGSICINGVSLTVVQCKDDWFEVAIIPYTYEHTTFHQLKEGDRVNLEFDIIGKYFLKYAQPYLAKAEK